MRFLLPPEEYCGGGGEGGGGIHWNIYVFCSSFDAIDSLIFLRGKYSCFDPILLSKKFRGQGSCKSHVP